jgi:hypothetical protein
MCDTQILLTGRFVVSIRNVHIIRRGVKLIKLENGESRQRFFLERTPFWSTYVGKRVISHYFASAADLSSNIVEYSNPLRTAEIS